MSSSSSSSTTRPAASAQEASAATLRAAVAATQADESISQDEQRRLIEATGILERLPPDFIPFDPRNTQPFTHPSSSSSSRPDRRAGMRPSELCAQLAAQSGARPAVAWVSDDSDEEEEGSEVDSIDSQAQDSAAALARAQSESGMHPAMEQTLDLMIWGMPFTFMFVLMDIMIQQQYAQHPTILIEAGRLLGTLPLLLVFIYFTAIRRPRTARGQFLMQAFLTAVSTLSGAAFLYIYSKSPYHLVIRRTPPLGTLWMYSMVRLDLAPSLGSLAVVYGCVRYWGLRLFD